MAAPAQADKVLAADEQSAVDDTLPSGAEPSSALAHGSVSASGTTHGEGVALAAERTEPTIHKDARARVTVDLRDLRRRWLTRVNQSVLQRAARDYSQRSRRRQEEGTVRVRLTVDATGRITSAAIATSSGHASLDRAAIQAVQSIGGVPSPPAELGWADRPIIVPVAYRLR